MSRLENHLRWLFSAPNLIKFDGSVRLVDWLPAGFDLDQFCADIDQQQRDIFDDIGKKRLGIYFEALYGYVLEHALGWEVLTRNFAIRDDEHRTLGEIDFLVRNRETGLVEHHEIAVKFYLGYRNASADCETLWYGPDSRDRLHIKASRLLDHQLTLLETPIARSRLEEMGLPQPDLKRIFMPGYLFYPADSVLESSPLESSSLESPQIASSNHLRGTWRFANEIPEEFYASHTVLWKPDWLGPWDQPLAPDPEATRAEIDRIAAGGRPRLFAGLEEDPDTGSWVESSRCFVVPPSWPSF